ncbi:pantoate--beta-alanine ligase [Desulfurivibrio sp. D14AmB]|uniref:pantoate--beta-alanine ligase n=1 Tax=Desulfurivibrio sp. D14AmB TaxID=3374370 RepID=UPI00376F0F8E
MKTVNEIEPLRQLRRQWRGAGELVALVPTMGNLHAGHLALVERGRELAHRVVVSIFVNPAQFDRADDLAAYPHTPEADRAKLAAAGVDCLFAPETATIYPDGGLATRVEVPGIGEILEGASRPGHFTGVATVVCKLFNLVEPELAIFGEKDFQQLLLIRRMVADLNMAVKVEALPTVRESDGLAMSSRNNRLGKKERALAPGLNLTLREIAAQINDYRGNLPALQELAGQQLADRGFQPDYVEIRRRQDLAPAAADDEQLVILAAAWLGDVRLIDNLMVG